MSTEVVEQQTYSSKQVAEQIGIKESTLYKWERDLDLKIARNKDNSRAYSEEDLEMFKSIKNMRDNKVSIANIRTMLNKNIDFIEQQETALTQIPLQNLTGQELQEIVNNSFANALKSSLNEFKEEFKNELNKEVLIEMEELKKQNLELLQELRSIKEDQKEQQKKTLFQRLWGK